LNTLANFKSTLFRFRQHFANIRNQERNKRNLVRVVQEKNFKMPRYPGGGKGQRVVYEDEIEKDIIAWYGTYGEIVGPLSIADVIRRAEFHPKKPQISPADAASEVDITESDHENNTDGSGSSGTISD
jgi:hypothetical protein